MLNLPEGLQSRNKIVIVGVGVRFFVGWVTDGTKTCIFLAFGEIRGGNGRQCWLALWNPVCGNGGNTMLRAGHGSKTGAFPRWSPAAPTPPPLRARPAERLPDRLSADSPDHPAFA